MLQTGNNLTGSRRGGRDGICIHRYRGPPINPPARLFAKFDIHKIARFVFSRVALISPTINTRNSPLNKFYAAHPGRNLFFVFSPKIFLGDI